MYELRYSLHILHHSLNAMYTSHSDLTTYSTEEKEAHSFFQLQPTPWHLLGR